MFIWMLMIIAIGYNSYNEKLKNFENKSTE